MRPRASLRHDDHGAQAVEFALIVPVLLILVLGIINFGYMFGQYLSLNQAVRQGARWAVVSVDATEATIATTVQDSTGGLISPPGDVTVTVEATKGTETKTVCGDFDSLGADLVVTAAYQPTWLVPTYIPLDAPFLEATSVFRCEVANPK